MAASYGYWPNEDAALRLVGMVPGLRRRGAFRALHLVGKSPSERMRRAASGQEGVLVTGTVPDVAPYLERASVVAIPLAAGSGTKLKVLEAMAFGKPVVTTPIGAEGLGLAPGVHAEVVELGAVEGAIDALLRDPARRAAMGAAGRALVEQRFSKASLGGLVRSLLLPHLAARTEVAT
jgi:glycosyltransferase involved in cell wall biosynthesis